MKKINLILFIMNAFLLCLLFFLYDPFSFFPKTYEDSPLLLEYDIEQIKSLQLILETPNEKMKYNFKRMESIWYLSSREGEGFKIANFDSLDKIFNGLKNLHKFEKEKRTILDSEFWGDRRLSIVLGNGDGKLMEIEFGNCIQVVSECLVREKNSHIAYTLPYSFSSLLPDLKLTHFQTRSPFAGLSFSKIVKISYTLKGVETYSVYKDGEIWKTVPDLPGEVEKKNIIDLVTRLRNWSGDDAIEIDLKSRNKLSVSPLQSLAVEYINESGNKERISVDDIGSISPGKKIIEVNPFGQYISMPAFNWEYWHFYDIKQLLNSAD
ncbi:hypothetical protein EHQ58_03105 [Leptospira ognonensis]|uniref:DUF4340 domain-containing protein n=1 Tax=Leptospira ognonensis TaxID=2484945 RepID=A0A4R9K922_9LEPT|nr:hypothetical protein [Leptospira ognonensis]TGL62207.1 hypothetical protein EHQ58_03105 [Leptospira ognonensis]